MASCIASPQASFTFFSFLVAYLVVQALSSMLEPDNGEAIHGGDLVSTTCSHTRYSDICITSLRSDPHSDSTDVAGLATIALDQSIIHADQTLSTIADKLKANQTQSSSRQCLSDCEAQYSDAIQSLVESTRAMKNRAYGTVNSLVSAAMTNSDTCEEGFKEIMEKESPLAERNEMFSKLCSNVLAILQLLL